VVSGVNEDLYNRHREVMCGTTPEQIQEAGVAGSQQPPVVIVDDNKIEENTNSVGLVAGVDEDLYNGIRELPCETTPEQIQEEGNAGSPVAIVHDDETEENTNSVQLVFGANDKLYNGIPTVLCDATPEQIQGENVAGSQPFPRIMIDDDEFEKYIKLHRHCVWRQ
jgi:hypothetical protein